MTVTGGDLATDSAPIPPTYRRSLRPTRAAWPIWVLSAGMPLAFVAGVHGFVWCLPGLVFGTRIIASRKTTTFPRSSFPLLLFLGWILLSAAMLSPGPGYALFIYRWLLWAGALTCMVWLVNVSRTKVPTMQIVDWLAALWVAMVAFGYLGVLFPGFIQESPFQLLIGPVGRISFIDEISRWRFAETQGFLGYPLPRPSAPFNATNGWGAATGILAPFFVRSWIVQPDLRRRKVGYLIGLAAVYPIIVSVNRGLWISLAVGMAYFAARKALRGQLGAFAVLVGALMAVVVLLVATPAGTLVSEKIDRSTDSNTSRSNLYELAFDGAKQSPLIGNGAPQRAEGAPAGMPPVGTHGMLWYLMYVHGFVGAGLFLWWLAWEVLRSGRVRTPDGWWFHLSLVIGLVQVPFYGLLPQVVLFGIAAGLSHREDLT